MPLDARTLVPGEPRTPFAWRAGVPDRDRFRGALLGVAIGDALGRPAEGRPRSEVRRRFGELTDFRPWRGWQGGPVGTYTDDTQMTLCVARSIVDGGGRLDPEDLARRFVGWLPQGRGKGGTCVRAVERLAAGIPWAQAGEDSAGNGAAMRVAPVGLLHVARPAELRRDAALSTVVTHANPMAVVSAVAQAGAVALAAHTTAAAFTVDGFLAGVDDLIRDLPDPGARERRRDADPSRRVRLRGRLLELPGLLSLDADTAFDRLWNGAFVLESLPAAWWCALAHVDDPERALVVAASGGRDADTVASMAGALVGAYHGVDGFPSRWVRDVEGADELLELADALWLLARSGDDRENRSRGDEAASEMTECQGDDGRASGEVRGLTTGGGMDIGVVLDHEMVAVESEREVHVLLELRVPEAEQQRRPLSLALVLDRSGSMAGQPLATVARAASYLVEQLGEDDEVALVTYDDEAELVRALGAPDAHLSAVLRVLYPGGMTNLSGGWLKGREQLASARHPARILLLTDGMANRGETGSDRLTSWAREAGAHGISTTCFGVGESFDEDLLSAMADAGGGTYHYVEGVDDAPAKFAEEFGDLALLAAQNVSVEVRGSEHVSVLGVLNEYPVVPVDGGLQAQLGDAYAGQVRRVVVRLVVPALAELGPVEVAEVVVRYTGLGEQPAMHAVTLPVVVNAVSAEDAAAAVPDARVVEEVTLLEAAKDVEEARRRGAAGDAAGSMLSLDAASEKLAMARPCAADPDRIAEQEERLDALRRSVASEGFTGRSSKSLHDFTHSNRRGRR